jgi:hypothetical protein
VGAGKSMNLAIGAEPTAIVYLYNDVMNSRARVSAALLKVGVIFSCAASFHFCISLLLFLHCVSLLSTLFEDIYSIWLDGEGCRSCYDDSRFRLIQNTPPLLVMRISMCARRTNMDAHHVGGLAMSTKLGRCVLRLQKLIC